MLICMKRLKENENIKTIPNKYQHLIQIEPTHYLNKIILFNNNKSYNNNYYLFLLYYTAPTTQSHSDSQ